jgi:hypothetical protein
MAIIEITPDGCVADQHVGRLRNMPTEQWLVYAAGVEKAKRLVRLNHDDRGTILVCPITGTLYDPVTGCTSDRDLYLLHPITETAT